MNLRKRGLGERVKANGWFCFVRARQKLQQFDGAWRCHQAATTLWATVHSKRHFCCIQVLLCCSQYSTRIFNCAGLRAWGSHFRLFGHLDVSGCHSMTDSRRNIELLRQRQWSKLCFVQKRRWILPFVPQLWASWGEVTSSTILFFKMIYSRIFRSLLHLFNLTWSHLSFDFWSIHM